MPALSSAVTLLATAVTTRQTGVEALKAAGADYLTLEWRSVPGHGFVADVTDPSSRTQDPPRSVRRSIDPSVPNQVAKIGSALATPTGMSKTTFPLFIATTLILTGACGSSGQGELAPGAEVTIEMPDGSLVTGRVAQPPSRWWLNVWSAANRPPSPRRRPCRRRSSPSR